MKNIIYLLGPTVMIFIGLYVFSSVPVTFVLFYGWLTVFCLLHRKEVGSFSMTKSEWLVGIGSGVLFYISIFAGVFVFQDHVTDFEEVRVLTEEWGFTGWGLVLVLIMINPFLEEVYWRGVMLMRLKREGTETRAIVTTAFYYSLYHILSMVLLFTWPLNVVLVLPVFAAGLFWAYIRLRTGSLVGVIISHLLADAGIMSIYWFFVR
ncbi:CPBP family intramembrane metalloprotease [Halobacillus litoralis]|uniref:CPBP family intramembrane glutamic endopeptidase n=1 Tax=Halobacillus litoralis TaxID=45668 RepID=UPI001CD74117|nr:type II CAAX endopeptidase family protein [Halobacillus litoralis]MCA0971983.1 CPBP family intramembrane metalloprotease [Halobacillus litoralis]